MNLPSRIDLHLETMSKALKRADTLSKKWVIRNYAKAYAEAARVLNRRDIQTSYSVLIHRAERRISKDIPLHRGKKQLHYPGSEVNQNLLYNIRQTHKHLSDTQFEDIISNSLKKNSPLTREDLKKLVQKQRIEETKNIKATKEQREKLKDITLYNLPISELEKKLKPNSLDLILTDPPYEKKALPVFYELSRFAGQTLKEGGSLLCMVGNMFLPWIYQKLLTDKRIQYHWTLYYYMRGPTVRIITRKVFQSTKPILWLTKGTYKGNAINNTFAPPPRATSSNEYHKWGQSTEGMSLILEKFAFPGDTVCDPFLGGGSTALAAHKRGCAFIGGDIDDACIKITQGRLCEAI